MAFKPKPLNPADYKMVLIKDLGQLPSKSNPKRKYRFAIFKCPICQTHFTCRATGPMAKSQTSCGNCAGKTHGLYDHPLYAVWNSIRQRCYNPKRKDYHKYGGKGVTMDPTWIDNPSNFIAWCEANGWSSELVVDKDIKSAALGISPAIYAPHTVSFVTAQQNAEEATAKAVLQLDAEDTVIAEFTSCTAAALACGKPKSAKSNIANCCRGVNKTAFGFKWKFK